MKRITKSILISFACLLLYSGAVVAETGYVREVIFISLREGPGHDQKVLAKLSSGQPLEILKPGEEWTQVRSDGQEGWVLSGYLVSDPPCSTQLALLQEQSGGAVEENNNLKEEIKRLQAELEAGRKQLQELEAAGVGINGDASDYLSLKRNYEKTAKQLAEAQKKAAQYEKALKKIAFRNDIKWFLSGAGVLVFGFLIGFSARPRRKTSLH